MSLKDIFEFAGDADTEGDRQKRISNYFQMRNEVLKTAYLALVHRDNFKTSPDKPFVRIFLSDFIPDEAYEMEFSRFHKGLHFALGLMTGSGAATFGEYDVLSSGWSKTSRGDTHPFIDIFPSFRFDYQDDPNETPSGICAKVLRDKSLMAQFELWEIVEVQTSDGEYINFEDARPINRLQLPEPKRAPSDPAPGIG